LEGDSLENDEHDQSEGNDLMEVRRSTRTLMSSTRLRDYVIYSITFPIENFISYENISSQHKTYLVSISKEQEPKNFQEVITNLDWLKAMKEDLKVLEKNKT
jgi:hypothetical protein